MGQQELPPELRVFTISDTVEILTHILQAMIYEPNTLVLESNVYGLILSQAVKRRQPNSLLNREFS